MKKTLLLIMGGCMLFSQGYNQAPIINVSTTNLSENLLFNDTSVLSFTIKNTGNRDLIYSLDILGDKVDFIKKNYADWTKLENQDRILPTLYITRKDDQGIFNIATENGYNSGISPENTEWARGKTKDLDPGDYEVWRDAIYPPPSMVNNTISMHILDRNLYYDVFWYSWTEDANGGGFSYSRYEVPFWLDLLSNQGSIAPGETDTIWVVFDARVINNTIREALIQIRSNDPNHALVAIDAALTIDGDAEIAVSDSSINFSDTFIGNSETRKLTLWNLGVGTLEITSISTAENVFSAEIDNMSIGAGGQTLLSVLFAPDGVDSYDDTLVILSNDPTMPELKIPLNGNGLEPPGMIVSPLNIVKEIVYSESNPYGTLDTTLLKIVNPGGNDLVWEARIRKAGTTSVFFQKDDYADYNLPENQDNVSENVKLTRQDIMGLYNAAMEPMYSSLSPRGTLWYNGYTNQASPWQYSESLRDVFNTGLSNLPGNTLSMYIPETDNYYDVAFESWTADGNGGGLSYTRIQAVNWLMLSQYTSIVNPSDSVTLFILFNPQGYQELYDAEIVLTNNVPGMLPITVHAAYTASGPPEIGVSESSIDFGDVFVTDSAIVPLTIYCEGASDLIISEMSTTLNEFTLSESSHTIKPNEPFEIWVKFKPGAEQIYLDTLVIESNAATDSVLKIPLAGNGLLPPVISASPMAMVHELASGNSTTDTLIISNTGDNNLEWTLQAKVKTSEIVVFTKEDYADILLPENQDRVSDHVWLTRGIDEGLYNIATESVYDGDSPNGTLWFNGLTNNATPIQYAPSLRDVFGTGLDNLPGNTLSMYVPETKIYYDVAFQSWTDGDGGGGFSYWRTEVPTWLRTSSTSGITPSGDSDTIIVEIDAAMVYAGMYQAEILIANNDPANGMSTATVDLTVTGTPGIVITDSILDMEEVMLGYSGSKGLTIKNLGTNELSISEIAGAGGFFISEETPLTVPAMDSILVEITFTPEDNILYQDTLIVSSNDPIRPELKVAVSGTGILLPEISVVPGEININLYTDSTSAGEIFVENIGESNLVWSIYENTLESILLNLNSGYQSILDLIPGRFNFEYDGGIDYINDGGDDMYDGANYISTNLSGLDIPYSDNLIVDGATYFGAGTHYFTRQIPGLFVMAADLNNVSTFTIDGNIGADGDGTVDGVILNQVISNNVFNGFVKRVYNAGDPSINQLVIVQQNENTDHEFDLTTNNDYHQVSGLTGSVRIYYLLYAGANGLYIDNEHAAAIMTEFIQVVTQGHIVPSWITFDLKANTLDAGDIDTINYSIDPSQLPQGTFNGNVYIISNDPVTPEVNIPINLQYGSILVVNPIADVSVTEGFGTWTYDYTSVFKDQQDDPLSYILISSNENIVTKGFDGNMIELTEVGAGTAVITLRATDGNGSVAFEDFIFEVNGLIQVADPLADLLLDEGFGTHDIDVSGVFTDSDNDSILLTAVSGDVTVATVVVSGNTLSISETGIGITSITLTASDGESDEISDVFELTINGLLMIENALADVLLNQGFGTHAVSIANVFSDPDGNAFTVSAISSNTSVATVTISGTTLTLTETGVGASSITVTANDGNGDVISDLFTVTVNPVIGIEVTIADNTLKAYPNPTDGQLTIELQTKYTGEVSVTLTDAIGRNVYFKKFESAEEMRSLNLSGLEKGIYQMSVKAGDIDFIERIILY